MSLQTQERLHWLALAILWPVFILQALWLRKTVSRQPEPACDRHGRAGAGPPLRVLILGDSAAAGVGSGQQALALSGQLVANLQEDFDVHWTVHAKTGWTTEDCLAHLDEVEAQTFDIVVTSLGVNDVTGLVPTSTWIARQECLAWRLRARFGKPRLFLSGVPPIRLFPVLPNPLRWWLDQRADLLSRTLEQWCRGQGDCTYIHLEASFTADMMAADGFHPGPPVYRVWGGLVANALRAQRLTPGEPR